MKDQNVEKIGSLNQSICEALPFLNVNDPKDPEDKLRIICRQSERKVHTRDNSILRASQPRKSLRTPSNNKKGRTPSIDIYNINRHDYSDLLADGLDEKELSQCSNQSGFSDADSFLTTNSNIRKENKVTHPF